MPRRFHPGHWVRFEGKIAKVLHSGVVERGVMYCLIAIREAPDVVREEWVPEDSPKEIPLEEQTAMALGAEDLGDAWRIWEDVRGGRRN